MNTKFLSRTAATASVAFAPAFAFAQTANFQASGGQFGVFLQDLVNFSNGVLIPFILAIGFLVFVWGMFRYFIAGGADEGARENGKNLMIYATLGFVLIIILWGVVNILAGSTGFSNQGLTNVPTAPVPNP